MRLVKRVQLKFMIQHIHESCGMSSNEKSPMTLYENNSTCVAQINGGFIKADKTKYISYTLKLIINAKKN